MDPVLPVALALLAAFFFAISSALVRARVRQASPLSAITVSLSVNVVVLWAFSLAWYHVTVDLWQWRFFILAGLLAPVLGRFMNYSGIDKLGVNLSTPITYANPLVSVFLALSFLGERLTGLGALGALLVVGGGALLGSSGDGGDLHFDRRWLVLPVLAAVFYGTSAVFRKVGVDLVGQPILAAAVTTTTSWAVLMGYLLLRRLRESLPGPSGALNVGRSSAAFFALAGLATSIAIPTNYLALERGSVVVVTPVMNTTPLFLLAISYLFFRSEELFTLRVVLGTLGIVAGITLLSTFGTV